MKFCIPALAVLFLCACSPSDFEPTSRRRSRGPQCVKLCVTDSNPCDPLVFKRADRRCDLNF